MTVQFERDSVPPQSFMIEPLECGLDAGLYVGNSLVQTTFDDKAQVVITNLSPLTQKISKGCFIGQCNEVSVIQHEELSNVQTVETAVADVISVTTLDADTRKEKLATLLANEGSTLKPQDKECLLRLLQEFHQAFVLDDGERGETDLISMEIDTGNAVPKRQPTRRTPFTAREEISRQLSLMQEQGMIRPSSSPWASPVVLVRKKDGSLRFCVDYRGINSVTKPDQFPLPRIDDLLDQLGHCKYFSTLDLAAGYWQV